MPRLFHLQILRAVAASLVVVDHTFGSLLYRNLAFTRYVLPGDLSGHTGVCAFFVLSGFIMMRQSAGRFGTRFGPAVFAWHRILRIVPMYWIATCIFVIRLLRWRVQTPHLRIQLLFSLCFIPDYLAPDFRLSPILAAGWTLNYEMAFYGLFAFALLLPRRSGVTLLASSLLTLVLAGARLHPPLVHSMAGLLNFYSDSIVVLFATGMLLGYLEIVLRRMPRFSLPVSPALLLAVPSCLFFALPGVFNFSNSLVLVRLWGILVVALCTLVASAGLGRANRILVLLGDASYSTYLFHLLIYEWTTPSILAIYTRLHSTPASPWAFIAAAVLAANLLGLAIHLAVERPMTRALRRLTFGPFRFLNDQ